MNVYKIKRPDNTVVTQGKLLVFEEFYTTEGWYEIKGIDSGIFPIYETNVFYIVNQKDILCYYKSSKYWSPYFNLFFNTKKEFERVYKIKVFG